MSIVTKLVFILKLTPINESAAFCVEITKQDKTVLKWEASWEAHPSWWWYFDDTIMTSDSCRQQCLAKERFLCIQLTIFKDVVKIIWFLGTEFSINDSRTMECSWDFVNEYVVKSQTQQHYSEPPIIV